MLKRHLGRRSAVMLLSAATAMTAGAASAAISESNPNDTLAQANLINRGAAPFADVGVLSLSELSAGKGDVDVFSITLNAGEVLTVATTPLANAFDVPDTELSLISSAGVILVGDDDSGSGSNPGSPSPQNNLGGLIQFLTTTTGTYYIAVTGAGDGGAGNEGQTFGVGNHVGAHTEVGPYALTLSIVQVPEPATTAILGVVGLSVLGRRRR